MTEAPEVITIDGGMVNAYLLRSGERFVLVDTLTRGKRALLELALDAAGASAGKLELIVVTHGDPDHTGSCAYLRDKLGARIAMHAAEARVTETGDMALARPNTKGFAKAVFSVLGVFFRPRKADRFTADVYLQDGDSLGEYGVDATVLLLPGHSEGSIGVLTAGGDLLCGDLMTNRTRPAENSLVDNPARLHASVERARALGTQTVYPGHGRPFEMSGLLAAGDAD